LQLKRKHFVLIGAAIAVLLSAFGIAGSLGAARRRSLAYDFRAGLTEAVILRAHGPPSWSGTDEVALRRAVSRFGVRFALPAVTGTCPVQYASSGVLRDDQLRLDRTRAALYVHVLTAVLIYISDDGTVLCPLLGST
jgi:hypothetical protein